MYAGKERRNRVIALAVAVLLLASVVLSLVATVASAAPAAGRSALFFAPAHVRLVSVWPADRSRLDQPPTELVLTFADTVRADLSQARALASSERSRAMSA